MKNNNKVFLTLFTPAENIHLIKDVGMIPYLMHKNHGFDSYIACYNNGFYPFLETQTKGLKLALIKKKSKNDFFNTILFLAVFKKIDILQQYHFSLEKLLICFICKFFTFGRIKTYIKLDANETILNQSYKGIRKLVVKLLLRYVDLVSAESDMLVNSLNHEGQIICKNIVKIPNGYYPAIDHDTDKENIILTVSRIGDPNKAIDLLMDGFKIFSKTKPNWKLYLIGSIENSFKEKISRYFQENRELEDKVFFVGTVEDREELQNWYKRSKIFVLTSISEGFPLVFPEALNAKCLIVSSNFPSAFDVTGNGSYGAVFNNGNSADLAAKLEATSLKSLDTKSIEYIKFRDKYNWNVIVERLNKILN